VLFPAVGIQLVERAGRGGYDAEREPGRVSHDLPRMRLLHLLGAQALKPGDLGGQVIGVDIHMHSGGSLPEALYEQPEALAVKGRAVIFGVVELRERLANGRGPERQLTIMTDGGYIDDDRRESAEMRHSMTLPALACLTRPAGRCACLRSRPDRRMTASSCRCAGKPGQQVAVAGYLS
jgi:hypothetical protein